jgi:hypothetical protein
MPTRMCGFVFTTTGRPCENHVTDGLLWCRAGHPIATNVAGAGPAVPTPVRPGAPRVGAPRSSRSRRPGSRTRRATELMRQAMGSEDSDEIGLRAESVLADRATASTLLGGPDASPAAQAAVVQRFGRVGALLVLGYEERGRAHRLVPVDAVGTPEPADGTDPRFETLVRDFADLDAKALYAILCEIDEDEPAPGDRNGVDAHRWLHATYAVAARDGTPGAHRAYMCALDRVMRLVRPLIAS